MANYNSRHTGAEIDNCVDNYLSAALVTAAITAAKLALFPVGSVYITINDNNPALFIGGTWVRIGQGRTLVGVGTGTDDNSLQKEFLPNESNGEYMHALSVAEMPSHKHATSNYNGGGNSTGYATTNASPHGDRNYWNYNNPGYSSNTGGGLAHTNILPYITVFFWQRTA